MTSVKPIPDGYHSLTPYLIVTDSRQAMDLYNKVFDAELLETICDGKQVLHAEVKIGDSVLMLSDENPDWDQRSPLSFRGTPVSLYFYVADVDGVFARALEYGFEVVMPVTDMFWGDRFAQVKDPFGHLWSLATHIEDLTPDEIKRRQQQFAAECG